MYSIHGSESCGDIMVRTAELVVEYLSGKGERGAHRDPTDLEYQQ